jgi:hypothetical protein
MLRDMNLWDEDITSVKTDNQSETTDETTNDDTTPFGKPKASVGLYVLQKNIKHSNSSERIQKCKDGQAGWIALCDYYERQTLPAKLHALQALERHTPGLNSNIRTSFNHHEELTSTMITTFGPTIKTKDLCNMIFINALNGYEFQTEYHKSQDSLDFKKFQQDVETAYDGRTQTSKPTSKVTTLSDCPTCHSKNYLKDGVCHKCHPCPKCTEKGYKYTWHAPNTSSCQQNVKRTPQAKKTSLTIQELETQLAQLKKEKGDIPKSKVTKIIDFVMDSGNTHPIVSNKGLLDLYSSSKFSKVALAGEGQYMDIEGAGTLYLESRQGPVVMEDILLCPTAEDNLLSVSRLDDKGYGSVFCGGYYLFPQKLLNSFISTNKTKAVFIGQHKGDLYTVSLETTHLQGDSPVSLMTKTTTRSTHDWHLATNHLNTAYLKRMGKMVDGMHFSDHNECDCETCKLGKAKRDSYKSSKNEVNRIGEVISGDWVEKLQPGINGETISLQLIDWYSRKAWTYQLSTKEHIQGYVIDLLKEINTYTGRPVTTLLLDQGSNFTSNALKEFCKDTGTKLHYSPVDTPEPNGRVERLHATLVEDVRCMLIQSGLPLAYWPYAIDYATYVRNLSPVAGLDKVPEHIWTDRRPDVSHLRIFGETCFPRIPNKDQRSKLLPRATTATFVGFDEQSRTYRCLDTDTNGLILAPHVQFMKSPKLPTINSSRFSDDSYLLQAQEPDIELHTLGHPETNDQSRVDPHIHSVPTADIWSIPTAANTNQASETDSESDSDPDFQSCERNQLYECTRPR